MYLYMYIRIYTHIYGYNLYRYVHNVEKRIKMAVPLKSGCTRSEMMKRGLSISNNYGPRYGLVRKITVSR